MAVVKNALSRGLNGSFLSTFSADFVGAHKARRSLVDVFEVNFDVFSAVSAGLVTGGA
jgi:hypothetical protein